MDFVSMLCHTLTSTFVLYVLCMYVIDDGTQLQKPNVDGLGNDSEDRNGNESVNGHEHNEGE